MWGFGSVSRVSVRAFAALSLMGALLAVEAPKALAAPADPGHWSSPGYVLVVADQADEGIAESQGVTTASLAYLGFDPNAWEATASNGYAPPSGLQTYIYGVTYGGTPGYLGLAGGANAPAGAISLQGADRQQTAQLLASFLSGHGGLAGLAHFAGGVLNYLPMGDSYSSGESLGDYFTSGESREPYNSKADGCDRAPKASDIWLAGDLLTSNRSGVDVQFIACSGATSTQMISSGSHKEAPQLTQESDLERQAFAGDAPDLITLTVGGDDAGFVPVIEHCAIYPDCGGSGYINGETQKILANTSKIEAALADIRHAASSYTSVLVADYPQILPSSYNWTCTANNVFWPDSAAQINAWAPILDDTVWTAAWEAGVNFVDVYNAFQGHAVCDKHAWINGITGTSGLFPPKGSYHPNQAGQQAYANAYYQYIVNAERFGAPLTPDGLPANPNPVRSVPFAMPSFAGPIASASAAPAAAPAGDTELPLNVDELTVSPHVADPNSCPTMFAPGEAVDITGGGFAPGASVTLDLMPTTSQAQTQTVTADDAGNIAVTVTLPSDLAGLPQLAAAGQFGYVEADGPGASATTESDDTLFNIGAAGPDCGQPTASPATASIGLQGSAAPAVPTSNAVFAITGPGLPAIDGAVPGDGSFAELDTDADGATVCPAAEPAGVDCVDGVLGGLQPGASYTATELVAPTGFDGATPQTFTADTGDNTAFVAFLNQYAGPPLPASAAVVLKTDQLPTAAGGVFALTGPGLPELTDAVPAPGAFAELDTGLGGYDSCPATEPAGVDCADGLITNLEPGAQYTITQVSAPSGAAVAPSQSFTAPTDGAPAVATFTDQGVQDYPTAAIAVTLTGTSSTLPVQGAAFAVTGPGLPALGDSASPAVGSYAELDTTATGGSTCPTAEPDGVTCANGAITGLAAGTAYTVTQITAPDGYKPAPPQQILTATDGSTSTAMFSDPPQTTPSISWSPPLAITYGTALSAAQLDATASVPGTFSYIPAAGTVLGAGAQALSVTFTPTDSVDYTTATAAVPLTVNKATPTLNWPAPASILYGTRVSATQLDATASVPGTFTYTPDAGTLPQPGSQTLSVVFNPTDSQDYTSATASVQLTVGFSQPCITTNHAGPLTVAAGQAICVGPGGRVAGPVTVQAGGALWVDGGTLTGPLTINNGATVGLNAAKLTGPLNARGAQSVEACASTITGMVDVRNTTGQVAFGSEGCAGNSITGPVTITDNAGGVSFAGDHVTGPVTITDNTGGFTYAGDTITGPATIARNT